MTRDRVLTKLTWRDGRGGEGSDEDDEEDGVGEKSGLME
jgi:hypothetical protein